MHIKQVVISGFRSFRNQCEIEPFSPKHNVIVGRNGSGKSNFFDAIQFVLLGPRFSSLRQEDRQHLLHEGAGTGVMAAYVEIIFDNSDGRIPIESDEVVLRRTVGHKKDEFFINRKRSQKSEVVSLLESAGFSKSNPYYIVQQGKVANLCVMKDNDRLNLLREVAGTTVYEERRAESLRILQETSSKQEQIIEVISFIKDRLNELDKEKEELKEYEQLDKNRRALEYTIYDKELTKLNDQLSQMESTREGERERQQDTYTKLREFQDLIQADEDLLSSTLSSKDRLDTRKAAKVNELEEISKNRSSIEAELQETDANLKAKKIEREQLTIQLKEVTSDIKDCETKLAKVDPTYESKTNSIRTAENEIKNIKAREESLYGKQGRGRTFGTVEERDEFLQKQINLFRTQVNSKHALISRMTKEINDADSVYKTDEVQLSKSVEENKSKIARIEEINQLIVDRTKQRNKLQETRKSSWKELEELQEKIQEAKQDLERGKQQLNSTLPRQISQGIASVIRIVEEKGLKGYFGPLIDNISLKNDAFRTAVEVAAGNSLFHIIVESDKLAAELMVELEKKRAGRLTFLPLNRLRVPDITYPDSNDVRALIDVAIDYEEEVELAIKQVFGKKLLARDLETASHFSKEYQLDAITKDGDVVNRKGGFEGGYRDERVSKIGAVVKIKEAGMKLEELSSKEEVLRIKSEQADAMVNEIMRELQKLETEREHLKPMVDQFTKEIINRKKNLEVNQNAVSEKKAGMQVILKEIASAEAQIDAYQEEQGTPLLDRLSDADRQELKSLSEKEQGLLENIKKIETELVAIVSERDSLKAHLKDNLYKRRDELNILLSNQNSSSSSNFDVEFSNLKSEKAHLLSIYNSVEKELEELESALESKRSDIKKIEKLLEQRKYEERLEEEKLIEATKIQDNLLNKRTIILENIQQKQKLIRDLGTLPRKELDDFKNLSEKTMLKQLREVNEHLKKYASVNRKALDQYVSFSEQRDLLEDRKEELEEDRMSIKTLLTTLDFQKEEAILRTFKTVSQNFSEVFKELVPGGQGVLNMKTTDDESSSSLLTEDNTNELNTAAVSASSLGGDGSNVSKFQGIQVRVSFSGGGQQYEMQQLSGGQKALVALALIFAIQRCDPAPFYLFDEVDQALDANYRAGVARLIQKQSQNKDSPTQFITTTFRPEMVEVAHKCYGIALQNKVSSIYPLEKNECQSFVNNLMNEEEAVGKITTVPAYSKSTYKNNYDIYKDEELEFVQENKGAFSPEDNDDDEEDEDFDNSEVEDEEFNDLKNKLSIRSSKRTRARA